MSETQTHRALLAPAFLPGDGNSEAVELAAPRTPAATGVKAGVPPDVLNPPGEALADVIVDGLRRIGWVVEYRWTTYVGHAFDARRGKHRYDVDVALQDVGDTRVGRWLVTAKRRTGFLRGLFKGGIDTAEHELLRHDIDAALAADPRSGGSPTPWVDEASWHG